MEQRLTKLYLYNVMDNVQEKHINISPFLILIHADILRVIQEVGGNKNVIKLFFFRRNHRALEGVDEGE